MKNKVSGFTLLEVLVVVIIIGILAALAYSSLFDLILTYKTKDAALNTAKFIERIGTESKRTMVPFEITVSSNGNILDAVPAGNNKNLQSYQHSNSGISTAFSGDLHPIATSFKIGVSQWQGQEFIWEFKTRKGKCAYVFRTPTVMKVQAGYSGNCVFTGKEFETLAGG